jgi:integrase
MEVNVYLIKSDLNSKGKAPLKIHVGSYIKIPLKVSISPQNWDSKKQRVKTSEDFYFNINQKIELKLRKINEYLSKVSSVDKEALLEYIKDEEEVKVVVKEETLTLVDHMRAYIERKKTLKSSGHTRNLKSALDHMVNFCPKVKPEQVNDSFMEGYASYLVDCELENVTIEGYVTKLKQMLDDALGSGYKINKNFSEFVFKSGKYKHIRLTWEEVEMIDKHSYFIESYNAIKDAFIFMCNTGLRDSDYKNLTEYSFIRREGKFYIRINSNKKTKDQLLVLNSRALDIARKYSFNLPQFSQQQYNRVIKVIARAAGVKQKIEKIRHNGKKRIVIVKEKWDMISTHTCRRTFARRWFDLGGDIRVICHFLGHESEAQTREYIGLDDDDTNLDMVRVFDQGEIFK